MNCTVVGVLVTAACHGTSAKGLERNHSEAVGNQSSARPSVAVLT